MADQKLTALTEVSVPVLTDIGYTVADPGGTPASNKITHARKFGLLPFTPGGRLTLETGVPVSTSDQLAKGTLYYTPYLHPGIRLWDGTRWKLAVFSEISLALTLTSGKNYDVFTNNGTSLTLSAAWSNDTTRTDALGTQNSIQVLNSDKTYLWLGTIRASATDKTADSGGDAGTTQVGATRFVWNAYNQVPRSLSVVDKTDSWSYNTATIRQADGAAGNKVEVVVGSAAALVAADVMVTVNVNAGYAQAGLGLDSTTTMSGIRGACNAAAVNLDLSLLGQFRGSVGLGYHYLSWNEQGNGSGTITWTGDAGAAAGADRQSGISGWVMG